MKITATLKTLVCALMLGAASQVMAAPVTLQANLTGTLSNSLYQGLFDGANLLPENFTINSIGFTFRFTDDADMVSLTSSYETSVVSAPSVELLTGGDRRTTVTTAVTTHNTLTGEQEAAQLSFGGPIFAGATSIKYSPTVLGEVSTGNPTPGVTTFVKGNGDACVPSKNQSCKSNFNQTVTSNVTSTTTIDYTGNFDLAGSLLSYTNLLDALMLNKSLGFNLGVTGDLILVSASLDLDITEADLPATEVPEPASLALFGIALLGFASLRRTRRD